MPGSRASSGYFPGSPAFSIFLPLPSPGLAAVALNSPVILTLSAPCGTVNLVDEKPRWFTDAEASTIVCVCDQRTNSWTCWASGLSLFAAHSTTPSRTKQSNHRVTRRGRVGLAGVTATGSRTGAVARALLFAGGGTGCPHFRQNCESSGRFALHRSHNTIGLDVVKIRHDSSMRFGCVCGKDYSEHQPRFTTKDTKTH